MVACEGCTLHLSRDGDLNLNTGLQADARLKNALNIVHDRRTKQEAHNLLDNLARGVEINKTLVDFEFVTIPSLGALTARLEKRYES